MHDHQWIAIDSSADRRNWALKLRRAHEMAIHGSEPRPEVRDVISASWRRSARSGVDPDRGLAPVEISAQEAEARWRKSPLSAAEPVMRELLSDVGAEGQQVVLACDAEGTMLWIDGEPSLLDSATDIHLQRGSRWDESSAGTNAMGTALATGHPIQVFSAEHYAIPVHGWTCSAAPVMNPETGELVGVLDLTGELSTAHPHSLGLIAATARMVEAEIGRRQAVEAAALRELLAGRVGTGHGRPVAISSPMGSIIETGLSELEGRRLAMPPQGGPVGEELGLDLYAEPVEDDRGFLLWRSHAPSASRRPAGWARLLGSARAAVSAKGRTIELSRRHSEILFLLSLRPEGLSAEQLALELYGDSGKPVTVRAEVSRMRRLLGVGIDADPYRLSRPLLADFTEVEDLAASGRVREALNRYPGPLLPGSDVPLVLETRRRLEDQLHAAVLDSGTEEILDAWLQNPSGRDDVEVCRRLAHSLGLSDPRRAATLSRLRRLCGTAD
jgi:hypothetical protein